MSEKLCYRCGKTKPVSEFSKDKYRKSGLQGYCKLCSRKYRQNYRKTTNGKNARKKHREKYPEKARARSALHVVINRGDMLPAKNFLCQRCGEPAILYHHHLGYEPEHALHVIPLCQCCHAYVHFHL